MLTWIRHVGFAASRTTKLFDNPAANEEGYGTKIRCLNWGIIIEEKQNVHMQLDPPRNQAQAAVAVTSRNPSTIPINRC